MQKFEETINNLKNNSQYRRITPIEAKSGKYIAIGGRKYINLSSNDYLGIGSNDNLQKNFLKDYKDLGLGATSARLLVGNSCEHDKTEEILKQIYNKSGAMVFNSGYHANVGIVQAIAQRGDVIFSDKLNHASIIDGMRLSDAEFYRYKHLDYGNLENLLQKHRSKYKEATIVSESVFSMDGDIANLKKLIELKNKYDAILMIDEAHAFGVFGQNGLGINEVEGVTSEIDLIVATFGKSAGSVGAFCVADKVFIEYLINKARSFIFSTALPPINFAWTNYVFENEWSKANRTGLLETAQSFRNSLQAHGIEVLGESQIIPIIIGDNEKTVLLSEELKSKGYWALPIRPPTVPQGQSRLRISLTADITGEELQDLPKIIAGYLS